MQHIKPSWLIGLPLLLILIIVMSVPGCDLLFGDETEPDLPTPTTENLDLEDIQPDGIETAAEKPGDPDWWKKQADLQTEDIAIQAVKADFEAALSSRDIDQAASYFSPDVREQYSKVLALSPDLLPEMAIDMADAKLSFLSLDTDFSLSRTAEYSFEVDGNTFYMVFIKIDGNWMIESY